MWLISFYRGKIKSSAFLQIFYYVIHFKILLKTNCIFIFYAYNYIS